MCRTLMQGTALCSPRAKRICTWNDGALYISETPRRGDEVCGLVISLVLFIKQLNDQDPALAVRMITSKQVQPTNDSVDECLAATGTRDLARPSYTIQP